MTFSMLIEWADKIDSRLGPISGRDADALAKLLRRTAKDHEDQDLAVRDAIGETARCADELAFWRYQAIWHRAMMLHGTPGPASGAFAALSRHGTRRPAWTLRRWRWQSKRAWSNWRRPTSITRTGSKSWPARRRKRTITYDQGYSRTLFARSSTQ